MSLPLHRCQQCGVIGLNLIGGRCSVCRNRTPVDVWKTLRGNTPADIRVEEFGQPHVKPALISMLLPIDEVERIIATMDMGNGRTMQYIETAAGVKGRYEFPLSNANMPSAEEVYAVLERETE
jgi:hypothetical protein